MLTRLRLAPNGLHLGGCPLVPAYGLVDHDLVLAVAGQGIAHPRTPLGCLDTADTHGVLSIALAFTASFFYDSC
jgi:hypothetical protein